jgi:hypothetical protein
MYQKTYNVLAVAIGGTFAFIWGNLHEALLTRTTDSLCVTAAFLHCNRSEYDCRD